MACALQPQFPLPEYSEPFNPIEGSRQQNGYPASGISFRATPNVTRPVCMGWLLLLLLVASCQVCTLTDTGFQPEEVSQSKGLGWREAERKLNQVERGERTGGEGRNRGFPAWDGRGIGIGAYQILSSFLELICHHGAV